jgi:aspartyl-tRNA(Asn)/glutamyl-tRNA(Gln) amidotransferase subunit B
MEYETVIGLEVHVQLQTQSKIFASSSAKYGARPNSQIDPVTLGMPGSLPVANKKVIDWAIMLGLATDCEINRYNRFARKHYFYPDLPKGYQISQFEEPICERGQITIWIGDTKRSIGIKRIHMEEDAGKSTHVPEKKYSLLDLNRAGVPLLEVVSEPELRSATEASAYLKTLRQLVRWLGISDGNMEEGSLRCDANVSLRPYGQLKFGTRTEIKNLNSFRFVEKAIEYEVARQMKALVNDENIVQETLLFDSVAEVTRPMRSKEESMDYRYMPDPDLPPVIIEESKIQAIRQIMPRLPSDCALELVEKFDLSNDDAALLTSEKSYYDYYLAVVKECDNPKSACNWITSELFGKLNKDNISIEDCKLEPERLGRLIKLIDEDVISGKTAKVVFEEIFTNNVEPSVIVSEKGLKQITDPKIILDYVQKVINDNPKQVKELESGNQKIMGYLVGQVMKLAGGNASPALVNEILTKEVKK